MPDTNSIVQAVLTIAASFATLIGVGGRRRRLRHEIRENLELLDEIQKNDVLGQIGLVSGWLHGRIALDVARLTGQKLESGKTPIPWGSVITATLLALGFAGLTYILDRDGFVWYSIFPGVIAFLMAFSVFGMFTGRERPPDETGAIPAGAVMAPTESATERVATALAIRSTGGLDDRLEPGKQADVVLRFVHLLQGGAYEAALGLADPNWLTCRIQAWLWNNREHFVTADAELDPLLEEILSDPPAHRIWRDFVATESRQFQEAFHEVDLDSYGIAGRRRRVAADLDVVILLPVGPSGGYFVTSATAVPNALTFLVRYVVDSGWLIANLDAIAPPVQGWPPTWWNTNDPCIDALPEPDPESASERSSPEPLATDS